MGEATGLDLAVVVAYLLGTLALAGRFARRSGTWEGFTVASRAVPTWAVGVSILGTFVSSISFIGNPGKSYSENWTPLLFALTVPLIAIVAGRIFVPLYRRQKNISAYAYLENRFGMWARVYGSISFQLLQLGRIGVILYLLALVTAPMLGVSPATVILVIGILVTGYTMVGGMEAVIWTDVVQVVVMLAGAAWCLALILFRMPEGPAQVLTIASEAGSKFSLGEMSWRLDGQTFLGVLLFGIISNLANFGIDQNYVQRYLSARNEAEARRAIVIATLPFIPVTALFLAIGTALFAFYRMYPALLPSGVAGDMVFPHFIRNELPSGVSGLLVAAIMAAAMSTISSSLNCMATVFMEDIYGRCCRAGQPDRQHVTLLRLVTVLAGVAGSVMGIAFIGDRSGLDTFWQIFAMLGSGLLGLFLLAILPLELNQTAVRVATTLAVLFVLWGNFSRNLEFLPPDLQCNIDPLFVGAFSTVLLMSLAIVLTRLSRRKVHTDQGELYVSK